MPDRQKTKSIRKKRRVLLRFSYEVNKNPPSVLEGRVKNVMGNYAFGLTDQGSGMRDLAAN